MYMKGTSLIVVYPCIKDLHTSHSAQGQHEGINEGCFMMGSMKDSTLWDQHERIINEEFHTKDST